jgi:two-component system, NarL family, response regulator NreC
MLIRVVLADDHSVVRQGLRAWLERSGYVQVVGEAADGREAVAIVEQLQPDVVVMDIAMPMLNGIDATAQIMRRNPDTKVIILSMHADESYILRALSAGAKGYLLKESTESDVLPAVQSVRDGKPYFTPSIARLLLEDYMRSLKQNNLQDSYDLLTEREREVLQLLAQGKSNKEVAQVLDLSPHTIDSHRTNMMQKLNLHNTAEIVLYAVRKGIIVP